MSAVCLLAGALGCAPAAAAGTDAAASRFSNIARRNVFHLQPVPPPPVPPLLPVPQPTVTLKGITTILGDKRALFSVKFPPGTSGAARNDEFFLGEGGREGVVEVLEIDVKAEHVVLDVAGTRMFVTFDSNSSAQSASAGVASPFRRGPVLHRRPG